MCLAPLIKLPSIDQLSGTAHEQGLRDNKNAYAFARTWITNQRKET